MTCASVIIPAFNAVEVIEGAVASALSQTLQHTEVLVVDDCSTDGTGPVVQRLSDSDRRVRLLRTPRNGGPGIARNVGIAAAAGEWVALLDADDRYHPERLERLIELATSSDADMVADNLLLCPADGRTAPTPMFATESLNEIDQLSATRFVLGNMPGANRSRAGFGYLQPLVRRSFLSAHGIRYDALRFAEDYIFALRCLLAGARWVLTPTPMYRYTISDQSLTVTHSAEDLILLQEAERALLAYPAVAAQPGLAKAMPLHLRSVERALAWFQFAQAVKQRDPWRALSSSRGDPRLLAHIGREGLRALPRAVRKLAKLRNEYGDRCCSE